MSDWAVRAAQGPVQPRPASGSLTEHERPDQDPQPQALPADRTALAGHKEGKAVAKPDARRAEVLQSALAMLAPAEDTRSTFERWTQPKPNAVTQTKRALRLISDMQAPEALPAVLQVIARHDGASAKALETFKALLPYAGEADLIQLSSSLAALPEQGDVAAAKADLHQATESRRAGVAPLASDRSLAALHWRDAGRGVLDFVGDMTVGTVEQIIDDPLHFPTQMIWGIGASFAHAGKDAGSSLLGLVSAGRYGGFGAQMTQSMGNAMTWASGFSSPRKTNLHPQFAEVQAMTKEGFARDLGSRAQYVKPGPTVSQWLHHKAGIPTAITGQLGKAEQHVKHGIAKLWYGTDAILPGETGKRAGAIWKDLGDEPMKADHVLGSASKEMFEYFSNKYNEASTINQHSPGAMPETVLGKTMFEELGLKPPKDASQRPAFLQDLQKKLDERYPQGYFLKGVADYNTGGNLPTNKSRFAELYQGYEADYKPFEAKLKAENPGADLQPQLKSHPHQGGRTLAALLDDPNAVVIQEKLPLKKYTTKDVGLGKQPFHEFRLHIVHGKVVPGASSHRWSAWHEITGGKAKKAAEAWAQSQVDKLPRSITHATALCPDVVMLEDGSFKFIEMNAFGNSGFLHFNPKIAHSLVEAVTGKETGPAYVMRRLGRSAAASTLVATHQPTGKPATDEAK
jgi:hypothetical protein